MNDPDLFPAASEPAHDHKPACYDLPLAVAASRRLTSLVTAELARPDGPRPGYLRGLAAVEARRGGTEAAAALIGLARGLVGC